MSIVVYMYISVIHVCKCAHVKPGVSAIHMYVISITHIKQMKLRILYNHLGSRGRLVD